MSAVDFQQDDISLAALLFEAGKQEAVPSDAVMDVLLDALKTGRSLRTVVDDHEILSRKQRESIHRFVTEQSRSGPRSKTVKASDQYNTPANFGPGTHDDNATPEDAQFRSDYKDSLPAGTERYEDHEEIGRGGWGVVVRSHDRQLDRNVAVKKLSPQASADPDVARRFLHEARITGQLQHPGIVPVYERGISLKDRQPFYAMKLLDGTTLRDTIRTYHDLAKGPQKRKQFHLLLKSFLDVCHAVGYAHDKNIVHRDLKPSNVVVGEFGETVVVDWGLAKQLGEEAEAEPTNEATLAAGTPMVAAATASRLDGLLDPVATQSGSVIGTPAFMAPEQARGANQEIDTRSDTYSLGVILYVILTGKPPFHGEDVQTTLKQVVEGKFSHPKIVDRTVPGPLASICTKAMSLDPAHRYETASELADDITRFLANESVETHRDSVFEKVSRWCRRHPALSSTVFLGTTILTVASTVTAILVSAAHQAETMAKVAAVAAHASELKAKEEAEFSEQQALNRLEQSRVAADAWLIDLSGTLERYPGMSPVREELIQKAISHYQSLCDSSRNNVNQKLETARNLLRLGDLLLLTGDTPEAEKSFTEGSAFLDSMDDGPAMQDIRREQANADIGLTLCDLRSNAIELTHVKQLEQTIDSLKASNDNSSDTTNAVARGYLTIGRAYESMSEHESAIIAVEESLKHSQRLSAESTDEQIQHLLTTVREDLARLYNNTQQYTKAARMLQDQIDAASTVLASQIGRPDLLESRAITRMKWAATQRQLGEDWAAEGAYREAVADLSKSWQLLFGDHFFSENLAIAQANLGQLALGLNQLEDAEKMLREAVDQLTGLMQSDQADRHTASRLAACNISLGQVLMLRGNPAAENQILRSIDIYDYLAKNSTLTSADQVTNAQAIANLSRFYHDTNRPEEAISTFNRAIKYLRSMPDDAASMNSKRLLAEVQFELAGVYQTVNDHHAATPLYQTSLESLSALSKAEPASQRTRRDSTTIRLIQYLLECDAGHRDAARAQNLLSELQRLSSPGPHIRQLTAIACLRTHKLLDAEAAIARAMRERRFPDAIDHAIDGCIQAAQGNASKAAERLERAELELTNCPGNRRLQRWVTELRQAIQSADSNTTASSQPE